MLNKTLKLATIVVFMFAGLVSAQTVKAASFEFVPSTNTYAVGCRQIVNIFADATGQSSNGADLEVLFDPSQVEILDLDPNVEGVQVRTGTAYDTYVFNEVNEVTGRIRVAAGSFQGNLTTRELFATIDFAGRPGATVGNFNIRVIGFGPEVSLDSNIADSNTNLDLLSSTVDGNYTFEISECEQDLIPPTNIFINPVAFSINNDYLEGVEVTVSDFGVGVDLSTVVIIINGVEYTFESPGVTYSGDPAEYTFFITLADPYPINQAITGVIRASDLAGNTSTTQIVFNIPPGQIACPTSGAEPDVVNITNNLCEFGEQNFINNVFGEGSLIDQLFTSVGTTGIAAALLGFLSLLWLLPLINAPLLLLNLLTAFLGRRTRRPWGLVLDGMSRKPISLATCRLFKSGTLFMVSQTVSDMEGRYGFSVSNGDYRLEISKDGFKKHVQEIKITEEEKGYITDVLMTPATIADSDPSKTGLALFFKRLGVFYKRVSPFLMFAGFVLSIVTMFLFRNSFNVIIFFLYILNYTLLLIARLRKLKKSSAIMDSKTKLRIPYAIIKIFDVKSMKLVDTMVSNENGEFEYFGDPGEYGILVAVRGYNFPSAEQTDIPRLDGIYNGILRVSLNRGNNNLKIYVDPVSDSTSYLDQGNLKTPFG